MWGLHLYKMARTLRGTYGLLLSTAKESFGVSYIIG